jgi:nicotinamidase-related amidase
MHCIRLALLAITASAGYLVALSDNPVVAQTIVDEWASVKAPPPPELKPVTLEAKTTGLLLLDFVKPICGPRPRCVASLPKVQNLASEARANGALVVHSVAGQLTKADILTEVAPTENEPLVRSGANKFLGTDLEKTLKDKGIKTVVIVGTAAHGAVLNTAAAAALNGFKVIVPIDGVSSAETYSEQYTAWHLANAPGGIGPNVTLTKTEMIKF